MSEKMTPGEAFRQAREAQGKTLEDAHTKTGITLNVLRQLEADQANAVEAVYLRLAARAYAEFLGLDPDEIAAQIRLPSAEGTVKIATSNAPRPVVAAKERKSTPLGRLLVLGAVGLVILLAMVYVFEQMDRADRSVSPPKAGRDSDEDLAAVKVKSEPVSPEPIIVATETEKVGATAVDPSLDTAKDPTAVEAEGGTEMDDLVIDEALLLEEAPLVLELEARTSTWVRVKWDGDGRFEGTLPAGARRRWEAQTFITVLSGRPRGFHYWFQNELVDDKLTVNPSGVLNFRATLEGIHIYPQKKTTTSAPADSSVSTSRKKDAQAGGADGKSLSNDESSL